MVWPMLLDMSRDDCKRVLRRLELEGYSAVLSAFRAQGDLTKEKKKILQDLQNILSISTERHRAEVRRAVNDEKFATIAHNISGANTTSEWLIEGRRLIPLMPRLVPQTAFTDAANRVANAQAEKNAMLPAPKNTAGRDVGPPIYSGSMSSVGVGTSTKISRPSSPASNVVVLPSGASIHIKGVLHPDDEEEIQTRKRRRSQSSDSLSSVSTQTPRIAYSSTPQASHNTMSPVKITISKSPQGRGIPSTSHTQPPKVILVTSSGQSMTPTVIHKSVSVPIVRASTATSTSMAGVNRGSIMMPSSPPVTMSSSNLVTVSSHSFTSPTSSVSSTSTLMGSPPVFQPSLAGKPRFRTIPRQRFPTQQHKPGVVIPMSSQPVHPTPQSLQNIQVKTITKPTIQIKQDGGMKIITQNIQGTSSKILPKPSHIGTSSTGTPVVVVNAGSGGQTSKVLNIATPGGRVITTSKPNVVTVNPKTLHLTAVKTSGGTTVSKPNVIVVQKTQQRRPQTSNITGNKTSATVLSNPTAFEKELVTFIQKQEGHGAPSSGKIGERKVIITTASTGGQAKAATILQRSKSEGGEAKSSLLAELIQAAGIVPDNSGDGTGNPVGSNEWFEYDVTEEQAQALAAGGATDPATLQAILGMTGQDQGQSEMEDKSEVTEVIDLDQVIEESEHTPSNYYTLEQAMTFIEPGSQTGTSVPPYTITTQKVKEATPPAVIVQQNHPQLMPSITALREDKEITYQTAIAAGPHPQFIGELDPETGLFYSGKKRTIPVASASESSKNLDLIRSSLEEANIDLDTLQYVVQPSTSTAKVVVVMPAAATTKGGNFNTEYGATIDLTDEDEQDRVSVIPKLKQEKKETPPNVIIPISEVLPELASPSETEATDAKPTAEDGDAAPDQEDANAAPVQKNADASKVLKNADAPVQKNTDAAPVQKDLNAAPVQKNTEAALVQKNADAAPVQEDSNTTPTAEDAVATLVQEVADAAPVKEDTSAENIEEASEAKDEPEEQEDVVPIYPEPDVLDSAMSITTSTTTQVNPQEPITIEAGDRIKAVAEAPVSIGANVEPSSGDLQPITEQEITAKIPEVTQEAPLPVPPVIVPIENPAVIHVEAKDVIPAVTKGEVTPVIKEEVITVTKGEATPLIESQESTTEDSFLMTSQSSLGSSSDSQGENDPSRPGKRKRKTPVSFDDSQSSSSSASSFTTYQAGWVRSAAGLLQKVCKYRGVNREKGELNASAWFIQPVDPNDAPDYYSIIKNPMDFGTIRKKLESGVYKEFDDFHNDMSLVKDNCFLYNPPTSPVRADCTDVFNYYHTEAEKLRDKWQKSHIGSPKKPRLDKSPGKS